MNYIEMPKPIFQRQIHMVTTNLRGGHVMRGYSSVFPIKKMFLSPFGMGHGLVFMSHSLSSKFFSCLQFYMLEFYNNLWGLGTE
jgi:hypothetical protein